MQSECVSHAGALNKQEILACHQVDDFASSAATKASASSLSLICVNALKLNMLVWELLLLMVSSSKAMASMSSRHVAASSLVVSHVSIVCSKPMDGILQHQKIHQKTLLQPANS